MVNITLRPGESNPNDIRLNAPGRVDAHVDGVVILVGTSITGGVATGTGARTGGSVSLLTPTFKVSPPKAKSAHAPGVVIGARVTLIPGSAYGFNADGDQIAGDWPPPDEVLARVAEDFEIELENELLLMVVSGQL